MRRGFQRLLLLPPPLVLILAAGLGAADDLDDATSVPDPDSRSEGLLNVAQMLTAGADRQAVLDELMDEQDLAQSVIEDGAGVAKDATDLIGNISDTDAVVADRTPDAAVLAVPPPVDAVVLAAKEGSRSSVSEAQLTKYEQDRLSAAELENVQLRKMLSQADSYESGLWAKMKTFKETADKTLKKAEGEIKAIPKLKSRVAELSKLLEDERKKESAQGKKLKALKLKFAVASQRTMRSNKALNLVRKHLKSLEAQNSELLQQLRNASVANKAIHTKVNATVENNHLLLASLETLKKQLQHNGTHLDTALKSAAKMQQKLQERIKAAEAKEKKVLSKQQENENVIAALQKTLLEKKKKLSVDKEKDEELRSKATEFAMQAKKGRLDEKTELHKLRETAGDVRSLQQEVKELKKKDSESKSAEQKSQMVYKDAKASLETVEKEIKKLRGNAPWLEAKVKAGNSQAADEAQKTRQAYEERDAAKAMLAEAKKKLHALQQQYAGVVTVIGETNSETKAEAVAGSSKSVASLRGAQAEQEPTKPPPKKADDASVMPAPAKKEASEEGGGGGDMLDQALAEDEDILSQTAALAEDNLLSEES
eukprot:TRINITY_DN112676_c0_g1_i1.p1 TRINITY_DN112676_c0_g1~~TRINITY_DN112676_c0_g1_i1.p1  ORF type:complete len:597 (-),score=251.52 TRINITY_DN112676_c0_g1_i1:88-1878(-)